MTLTVQELFQKIILGNDTLHMRAICQFSLGEQEAVSLLVGSRCTTLVGSIGLAKHWKPWHFKCFSGLIMETYGLLQKFIKIYKLCKFFFCTYKFLIGHPNYMHPKSIKRCPNFSRIVPAVFCDPSKIISIGKYKL